MFLYFRRIDDTGGLILAYGLIIFIIIMAIDERMVAGMPHSPPYDHTMSTMEVEDRPLTSTNDRKINDDVEMAYHLWFPMTTFSEY